MKILRKRVLAVALLLGTSSFASWITPAATVYAAASSTTQNQLQQELATALKQRLPSAQITYSGSKATMKTDIANAMKEALNTDDYLHYIVKSYSYSAAVNSSSAIVTFEFTYWETLAQTEEVKSRVGLILGNILTPNMSDYQKEKAIHDWIIRHIAYDKKLTSHSAYDGLISGKTVCQGYALLTYEMMRQAEIPVKIVEGSSRGIGHAWNLVQIEGNWYHLDCTWDDPDAADNVRYNYFNLTDDQLRKDHTWKSSGYPTAKTTYNTVLDSLAIRDAGSASFYNQMNALIGSSYLLETNTAISWQSLSDKIRTALNNRQPELSIRYTKGATIKEDLKKAFAQQSGVSGFSYTSESFTRTTGNDKILNITFSYLEQ